MNIKPQLQHLLHLGVMIVGFSVDNGKTLDFYAGSTENERASERPEEEWSQILLTFMALGVSLGEDLTMPSEDFTLRVQRQEKNIIATITPRSHPFGKSLPRAVSRLLHRLLPESVEKPGKSTKNPEKDKEAPLQWDVAASLKSPKIAQGATEITKVGDPTPVKVVKLENPTPPSSPQHVEEEDMESLPRFL